jgi:hypothetical protein
VSREAQRIVNDAADEVAVKLCRAPDELEWMISVCRAAAWAGVTKALCSDVALSRFGPGRAA